MALNVGILKKAIEEAEKSPYFPYRIGAVFFKGSRIFGFGHNDVRSCRVIPNKYKQFKEALHAEQAALAHVKSQNGGDTSCLQGASIFVIRINATTENISMARPCFMCHSMLKRFKVRWMYYSDKHEQIIKEVV